MDDSTLSSNASDYLNKHLTEVVQKLENELEGPIQTSVEEQPYSGSDSRKHLTKMVQKLEQRSPIELRAIAIWVEATISPTTTVVL